MKPTKYTYPLPPPSHYYGMENKTYIGTVFLKRSFPISVSLNITFWTGAITLSNQIQKHIHKKSLTYK